MNNPMDDAPNTRHEIVMKEYKVATDPNVNLADRVGAALQVIASDEFLTLNDIRKEALFASFSGLGSLRYLLEKRHGKIVARTADCDTSD